jgi:hypothetical protein
VIEPSVNRRVGAVENSSGINGVPHAALNIHTREIGIGGGADEH